jgi:gliding motility-associated-like protein
MTLTNTVVDLWGRTDGVSFTPLNQPGYTYRRLNTATVPSTTWSPADWTALDPEDYTNVGSYSLATSNYEYSIDNGVTYQAGLTFNNLAPGNHILIVKDLITGCLSVPVTIVIDTLNPTPSVTTFTYVTPVCQNATSNPIPDTSATGFTTGGTFSEYLTTGLVFINTSTGEIDLANSTPGSHTIRYSVALNSTTCIAAGFTDFPIVINPVVNPNFSFGTTLSICSGGIVPTLPTSSSNSITGSWSPAIVDNANNGTYTFTPDAGQCANITTFTVTITPQTTPTFSFGTTLSTCSGGIVPALPTSSSNSITGSWSPAIVDNANNGIYTFTPNAGQCANTTTFTVTITPQATPTFSFGTTLSICSGGIVPALPNVSSNSITGSWSPTTVDNAINGTYTFQPNAGQCSTTTTLSVTVTPRTTPTFSFGTSLTICSGDTVPTLPNLSSNSINGTWSPTTVDNANNGTYTFQPNAGQCATTTTLSVTVTSPILVQLTGGCESVNYILTVTPVNGSFVPETASYSWQNAAGIEVGTTQSITVTEVDLYTVTITVDGCATESQPFDVTSVSCVIQKGISVNNDNLNDTFDLSGFDVKKLTIFNRLGMKVYSRNNYVDEWGGNSDDGDELPDGTYYYVIEQRSGTVKTGWIYINRAQ